MDLEVLGGTLAAVITGASTLIGGAWLWIQKQRRNVAETKAAVAEDQRDRTVADSQRLVYELLNQRLGTVEQELKEWKLYTRKLELHINKLEKVMAQAGLEIPELVV